MIELYENQLKKFERQSSKGNQLKWQDGEYWYKADYAGYEALAEYIVSKLLKKSNLNSLEFVEYDLEQIKYKRNIFNGVKSKDFLEEDWQMVTLERLYKTKKNVSLLQSVWKYKSTEERIKFLVDEVCKMTGIDEFGIYLSKMLTIDAFFLNEDRHMHNIAVLMDGAANYKLCPIFDNGAALLSDTSLDYPLSGDIFEMMDEVKSKTICTDFDEQLDAVEKAFGYQLKFDFDKNDVDLLLDTQTQYPKEIIERVRTILYQRIRKYQYLFN